MNPIEIASPADFQRAVPALCAAAEARGARTLWWCDPDFAAWPLDDPGLLDGLTAWLRRPGRRLVMLASRFDRLEQRHPRFVQWRPTWSHAVEPRTPADGVAMELPTLLLDDGPLLLRLWQADPPRGRAAADAAVAAVARDDLDACLQRSEPAWPVKPLGL